MKILGIETSSSTLSVALSEDDTVLFEDHCALPGRHAALLAPMIDTLLHKAGYVFKDIDAYAVGLGPGSFTGLRVGLATVKTFAAVTGCPVVGMCSLDVIAHNVKECAGTKVTVIVDAKRNNVYTADYVIEQGSARCVSDYQLEPAQKVIASLPSLAYVVGDAVSLYSDQLCRLNVRCAASEMAIPRASAVCALGWQRLKNGDHDDSRELVPLYLYDRECSVRKSLNRNK